MKKITRQILDIQSSNAETYSMSLRKVNLRVYGYEIDVLDREMKVYPNIEYV